MTKKTYVIYSYIFLFVFTFALALTLAGDAQAELDCCVYEWCPGDPPLAPGIQGHMFPISPGRYICVYDLTDACDMVFICSQD